MMAPRYIVEALHWTSDGATWCLTRDTKLRRTYVRHEASDAAGQTVTYKDIADFLLEVGDDPQYHDLVRQIDMKAAEADSLSRFGGMH
jgi:hypothetical protein